MRRNTVLLILLLVLVTAWNTARARETSLRLEPCEIAGLEGPARCGVYEVFENRDTRKGRKIAIRIVVLPATGAGALADPLVFIAGGPGDSSTAAAPGIASQYAELRGDRDILLVDLRGSGGSHPLRCAYQDAPGRRSLFEDFLPTDGVHACVEQLSERADLTRYTTPIAVDDLDEIRGALGYERLNLVGVSYGTRAAQVYLRRHPERVRTVVLHAPVPPGARMPSTFARDFQLALEGRLRECAEEAACATAFPHLEDELSTVAERLRSGPVEVALADPASGTETTVQVTRAVFAQTLRYMLYLPSMAAQVPLAIHRAAAGDFGQVAQAGQLFSGFLGRANEGLYMAVTCTEDVPYVDEPSARRAAAGTLLGDYRLRRQTEACSMWPRGTLPPDYHDYVQEDAPVLIVVGEFDPSTPPRMAREVAARLPNSLTVVVPGGGHDFVGMTATECIERLQVEFIRRGTTDGLDTGCVETMHQPAFVTQAQREITLSEAQLARLTGTYAAEDGPSLTIESTEGRLRAVVEGSPPLRLIPKSVSVFGFEGLPPDFSLELEVDDTDAVGAVIFHQGAERSIRLLPVRDR